MSRLHRLTLLATVGHALVAPPLPPSPPPSALTYNGNSTSDTPLPLVIWHGLGDNYANSALQSVGSLASEIHPGTYVHVVSLASSPSEDQSATFFGDVNAQIDQVCARLASDPILSTAPAVDALGFSQGGQFLRAYVQRCNFPPVRSLVTFGAQHNGIVDYRACAATDWVCKGVMAALHRGTFTDYVQGRVVPAQYFRDPADLDPYLASSHFLADVNNERAAKNATYAANLAKLQNLVLYMFADDTTVVPKESAWFDDVDGDAVTPLRARDLYRQDWLGLKQVDRRGGLFFRETPGEHMQIDAEVLGKVFKEFFGPEGRTFERAEREGEVDEL